MPLIESVCILLFSNIDLKKSMSPFQYDRMNEACVDHAVFKHDSFHYMQQVNLGNNTTHVVPGGILQTKILGFLIGVLCMQSSNLHSTVIQQLSQISCSAIGKLLHTAWEMQRYHWPPRDSTCMVTLDIVIVLKPQCVNHFFRDVSRRIQTCWKIGWPQDLAIWGMHPALTCSWKKSECVFIQLKGVLDLDHQP